MCDEWMPRLELPLTIEQFRTLPRHAAYKYEYYSGAAWLNPRPRYYHALLDLTHGPAARPDRTGGDGRSPEGGSDDVVLRPLREADWEELVPVFAAAFCGQQPFGGLDDELRLQASRKSLRYTRAGGDGPWIEAASFLAEDTEDGVPVGAILITLLPDTDPTAWDAFHWREPPPTDALARRMGRPHLTWIFVNPLDAGQGVGTLLLSAAVRELRALGYTRLASTFMLGNDSSMLWHWRQGFQLLAYPGSRRKG
jgi:GNAT superfamily N-acetyltransferase